MNAFGIDNQIATRRLRSMASVVLAEMLHDGVIKGGTGLNVRYGPDRSRFSTDVDTTRPRAGTLNDFLMNLQRSMSLGWQGFTAVISVPREQRAPEGIPAEYAVCRAKVKVDYLGSTFATVELEVSIDEVESLDDRQTRMSPDVAELFTRVGLAAPEPVPVMSPEHQIAQKLHACTTPDRFGNNDRAHDLVDIHILRSNEDVNAGKVAEIAARLFALRGTSTWPTEVHLWPSWRTLYQEAAEGIDVPQLETLIEMTNEFIRECVTSHEK